MGNALALDDYTKRFYDVPKPSPPISYHPVATASEPDVKMAAEEDEKQRAGKKRKQEAAGDDDIQPPKRVAHPPSELEVLAYADSLFYFIGRLEDRLVRLRRDWKNGADWTHGRAAAVEAAATLSAAKTFAESIMRDGVIGEEADMQEMLRLQTEAEKAYADYRDAMREHQPLRTGAEAAFAIAGIYSQAKTRARQARERKNPDSEHFQKPLPPGPTVAATGLYKNLGRLIVDFVGHACKPVAILPPVGMQWLVGMRSNRQKATTEAVIVCTAHRDAVVLTWYRPSGSEFKAVDHVEVETDTRFSAFFDVGHNKVVLVLGTRYLVYDIAGRENKLVLQKDHWAPELQEVGAIALAANDRDTLYFTSLEACLALKLSSGEVQRCRGRFLTARITTMVQDPATGDIWTAGEQVVERYNPDTGQASRVAVHHNARVFAFYDKTQAMTIGVYGYRKTRFYDSQGQVLSEHTPAQQVVEAWQCADYTGRGYYRLCHEHADFLMYHCVGAVA